MLSNAQKTCNLLNSQFPDFTPKVGVILGSGLGSFAEQLTNVKKISYTSLPGFPNCDVVGHAGTLTLGYINNIGVVCMQGRAHSYEGPQNEIVKTYVRTFKLLGCEQLLIVNAAGSLRTDVPPGELVLINDHINLQPTNPLVGKNDDEFGPRFFPLDKAYDLDIRKKLLDVAKAHDIKLHEGIYLATLGPNYETAAEIRAFKTLGADVVGMSTVPEVLVASHCGLKVAVISTITNFATGLTTISHSHDEVVKTASNASAKLNILLKEHIALL